MKDYTIYYGISGTFKTTTLRKQNPRDVMFSKIKVWKNYESSMEGLIQKSDLNFALLHLCLLTDFTERTADNGRFWIERGVSDACFYWLSKNKTADPSFIDPLIRAELRILGTQPKKILFVQRDESFIENTILLEPTRRAEFPGGLKDYLSKQEEYIEFTKTYNKIDQVIEINNALNYINNL